jgi:pSer/pThr/pTyr-binding forkhead associated (FHA) protein
MPCLVITTGEAAGSYFPLTNRTLTAGRDPARDIQILDPKVSRKHFQVRKEGDGYTVIELKSRNGVYVNGSKVKEHALRDGDEIGVGDTLIRFLAGDLPSDRTDALQRFKKATPDAREDRTIQN